MNDGQTIGRIEHVDFDDLQSPKLTQTAYFLSPWLTEGFEVRILFAEPNDFYFVILFALLVCGTVAFAGAIWPNGTASARINGGIRLP